MFRFISETIQDTAIVTMELDAVYRLVLLPMILSDRDSDIIQCQISRKWYKIEQYLHDKPIVSHIRSDLLYLSMTLKA